MEKQKEYTHIALPKEVHAEVMRCLRNAVIKDRTVSEILQLTNIINNTAMGIIIDDPKKEEEPKKDK